MAMTNGENGDTLAHVRYFKMLEVAYNPAKNGYYKRSASMAEQATTHYSETSIMDHADSE